MISTTKHYSEYTMNVVGLFVCPPPYQKVVLIGASMYQSLGCRNRRDRKGHGIGGRGCGAGAELVKKVKLEE